MSRRPRTPEGLAALLAFALAAGAQDARAATAQKVEARFGSTAAAEAVRHAVPLSSAGFALRLVDEDAPSGEASSPPNVGDEKLPVRTGGELWVKPGAPITGEMIADAHTEKNEIDGSTAIDFRLTEDGRKAFAAMTSAAIDRRIAIVVDGVIVSAPRVTSPITGGEGLITCGCTYEEAQALVDRMKAHAADVPLNVVERP